MIALNRMNISWNDDFDYDVDFDLYDFDYELFRDPDDLDHFDPADDELFLDPDNVYEVEIVVYDDDFGDYDDHDLEYVGDVQPDLDIIDQDALNRAAAAAAGGGERQAGQIKEPLVLKIAAGGGGGQGGSATATVRANSS